jgi:hypothetical protein
MDSASLNVLVLGAADTGLIEKLAGAARLVVALAQDGDTLRAARRALAHCANVMVVAGAPDEIPWQEGFFDRVVDPMGGWPDRARVEREVRRVMAPAGIWEERAPGD